MNDADAPTTATGAMTAGRLLREARQAQGLHIAALASAIKVAPRKLELLETDRIDELPDATFTRALAQTVCRSLKVDAAPILALLPPPSGYRLEQVGEGLNTPFRERPSHAEPNDWTHLARPAIWGPALLLLAAAAVYLMPAGWLPNGAGRSSTDRDAGQKAGQPGSTVGTAASATMPSSIPELPAGIPAGTEAGPPLADNGASRAVDGASAPAAIESPVAPTSAPAPGVSPASPQAGVEAVPSAVATAAAGPLSVHASADSWVEVLDARGQALLSRLVRAGETVGVDGALPMRLKVGNARGTEIAFRGRPVELEPYTRDTVARFELK